MFNLGITCPCEITVNFIFKHITLQELIQSWLNLFQLFIVHWEKAYFLYLTYNML